jgi:DNA-directed RNA polymerase specialized sigma24 family protein
VPELSDETLRALLIEDPGRGWRAFVDQYTSTLLALIVRAGVADRDDAADVYVRVCERLAENDCARLRKHDPSRGALAAWLTVVVRRVVVDWLRSRAGRRRLFRSIRRLDPFDQRVFELYYWQGRRPAEIAELTQAPGREAVTVSAVLAALERIQEAMTDRHRSELLALMARARPPVSLDEPEAGARLASGAASDPEHALGVRELDVLFASALADLPAEDAAIVRLTFVQGWSREQVRRGLHLDRLSSERIASILERLKQLLAQRRLGPREAATPGLGFLEGGSG